MNDKDLGYYLIARKCPVCGREFYIHCETQEYAYKEYSKKKHGYELYCSYGCLRKAQKSKGTEFVVKRYKKILCRCSTREEAVKYCESNARNFISPKVNAGDFKDASIQFNIVMKKDGFVVSHELYTVIVVLKK